MAGRYAMALAGAVALVVPGALGGCDRVPPPRAVPPAASRPLRLVSLAPALTQMIVDLGAGGRLVAVAENDRVALPGLPVVGDFADVDTELILSVSPTHVLMMSGKEGPPRRLQELAGAGHFALVAYPQPVSIEQVGHILFNERALLPGLDNPDPLQPLGTVLGLSGAAQELKYRMFEQLARLSRLTTDLDQPEVLMVIGTNQIMASGPGTVNDQLLAHAGGLNAAGDAAATAPTFDREAMLAMNPQVILLMLPGARELEVNDLRLAELADLPIRAVTDRRIVLLNDPLVVLPSTSLVRTAAAMAAAIHPQLKPQIQRLVESPSRGLAESTPTRSQPNPGVDALLHP